MLRKENNQINERKINKLPLKKKKKMLHGYKNVGRIIFVEKTKQRLYFRNVAISRVYSLKDSGGREELSMIFFNLYGEEGRLKFCTFLFN